MTLELHHDAGYVPMRVLARMDEPVAYLGDLLHLDGPLHYAALHALDLRTRKEVEPIDVAEWPQDFGLPLSTWSTAAPDGCDDRLLKSRTGMRRGVRGNDAMPRGPERRLWGWCASAVDESTWLARGVLEIRKKPDLARMRRYTEAKSANLGAGPMKAYDLRIPTVAALDVVWFAHGDPDRVRHLLTEFVPSIGKKRSTGNGRVREWIVEPCAEDRSVCAPDGAPTRRLPVGAIAGPRGHGAIRPPYYHHTRMVESVEPWA